MLVDATYRGRPRKLLLQANRNGFYYILDRVTGEFLQGTPFVDKLDWATGLDGKGRPLVAPGHEPTVKGAVTCPSTAGATNWPPPTYSRDTGYLYVPGTVRTSAFTRYGDKYKVGLRYTGGGQAAPIGSTC